MKYARKVGNGIAYIATAGALGLGFFFVLGAILSEEIGVGQRIACGVVALVAFLIGYTSEGGGETDTDEEDEDVAA